MTYGSGCLVAFCIYVGLLIYRLCESPAKKINMEKVYIYYEIWNGLYKDTCLLRDYKYKKPSSAKNVFMCIWTMIYNTALSRVSVFFRIVGLCVSLSRNNKIPDKIKEIDFKLSNSILSKHEVQHLIKEKKELSGMNGEDLFRWIEDVAWSGGEYVDYIYLRKKDKYDEVSESVCIFDDLLMFSFRNPAGTVDIINQYRIEGNKLETRTIENENYDYEEGIRRNVIKDGKVHEEEIEEKWRKHRANKLKDAIEWDEDFRVLVKTLVYIHNSSLDASKNFIKERIKDTERTSEEYIKLCRSYGFDPLYEEDGSFRLIDEDMKITDTDKNGKEVEKTLLTKEKYKKFSKEEDELLAKYGVNIREIPFIRETLEKMLDKLKGLD